MRRTALYLTICTLAAFLPLLPQPLKPAKGAGSGVAFSGFPAQFEGHLLRPLPLTERELRFGGDFPGQIGRFTDGRRELIIRWVTQATRRLHPASDCFEGIGFHVQPLPLHVDEQGLFWSSFIATRKSERLRVRERIYTDAGETWTDVSSWYWPAALERTTGPWWAITIAERDDEIAP